MNKPSIALLLGLILFALPLTGCGTGAGRSSPASSAASAPQDAPGPNTANPDPDPNPEPLRIVSTIFPPYDFVRAVAGERAELTMLLRPGAESHSYDPSPQDLLTIQDCDLFLYVGGENDRWVEKILGSLDGPGPRTMRLTDLVEAVGEELVEGMEHGHSHSEDEDHDHEDEDHDHDAPELDEHVWTSPVNAMAIVTAITDQLCALDAANTEHYRTGEAAYLAELAELDRAYRELTAGAARRTLVFGDRFPFRYLADEYGLDYFAAFPGCSTETEASPATVAFLVDKVVDEDIPVVFHIELGNERMADAICAETGAAKRRLHSCHNLSRDDFQGGATYLSLMWENLEYLEEALH